MAVSMMAPPQLGFSRRRLYGNAVRQQRKCQLPYHVLQLARRTVEGEAARPAGCLLAQIVEPEVQGALHPRGVVAHSDLLFGHRLPSVGEDKPTRVVWRTRDCGVAIAQAPI